MDHAEAMLDKLLETAKQVGGEAWPMLVRATQVRGIVNLSLMAVFVLLVAVFGKTVVTKTVRAWEEESNIAWGVFGFSLCLFTALLSIVIASSVSDVLVSVFAPEGYTLLTLLGER